MKQPSPPPWHVEAYGPEGPKRVYAVLAQIGEYPSTVCHIEDYQEVPGADIDRAKDADLLSRAPGLASALGRRTVADDDLAVWLQEAVSEPTLSPEFRAAIGQWLIAHEKGQGDLALARGPINNKESEKT